MRRDGFLLDDSSAEVRDYQERVEANPARLEEVDERLDLIKNLKRKYGATIAEVIDFGERSARELEEITGEDSDLSSLQANEARIQNAAGVPTPRRSPKNGSAGSDAFQRGRQSIAELNMGRSRLRSRSAPR